MCMSHHQNVGIGNKFLKKMGIGVTDQNCIHEGIESTFHFGNARYYSIHNVLSSCLLSKHLKMKTFKTMFSPVVLYGCETWSLTLR